MKLLIIKKLIKLKIVIILSVKKSKNFINRMYIWDIGLPNNKYVKYRRYYD